jgi:tRNA(Ile2) C34 agmatinyltransferase TiaS
MPQAFMSSEPSLTAIERPHCPKCQTRMILAEISLGPKGFDQRGFECEKCGSVYRHTVVTDPMKSRLSGWLEGELKAPREF